MKSERMTAPIVADGDCVIDVPEDAAARARRCRLGELAAPGSWTSDAHSVILGSSLK